MVSVSCINHEPTRGQTFENAVSIEKGADGFLVLKDSDLNVVAYIVPQPGLIVAVEKD